MGHLGPNLTHRAKFGYDRFAGAGAPKPPFHVDFGFFIFYFIFFSDFFDRATAQTAEPISMVGGSNDVFSRKKVPLGSLMIT